MSLLLVWFSLLQLPSWLLSSVHLFHLSPPTMLWVLTTIVHSQYIMSAFNLHVFLSSDQHQRCLVFLVTWQDVGPSHSAIQSHSKIFNRSGQLSGISSSRSLRGSNVCGLVLLVKATLPDLNAPMLSHSSSIYLVIMFRGCCVKVLLINLHKILT